MKDGGLIWIVLPTPLGSDTLGPSSQHLMILDEWFMKPCLKKAGFDILYSVNTSSNYDFLCKKMPFTGVEPWQGSKYRELELLEKKIMETPNE